VGELKLCATSSVGSRVEGSSANIHRLSTQKTVRIMSFEKKVKIPVRWLALKHHNTSVLEHKAERLESDKVK